MQVDKQTVRSYRLYVIHQPETSRTQRSRKKLRKNNKVSESLSCTICTKRFNECQRLPKILNCFHTFCLHCLSKVALTKRQTTTNKRPWAFGLFGLRQTSFFAVFEEWVLFGRVIQRSHLMGPEKCHPLGVLEPTETP